jgi:single-stranded-DNA-specific exonuclease
VDVIVTDHHTIPSQIPEKALAIIHPLIEGEPYPGKTLSGGGVAYKVAQAFIRTYPQKFGNAEAFEKWLVDYVAVASIADMVPLIDETRTLVHFGLKILPKSQRPGLRLLAQNAGAPFTERSVGFFIAPRLNAAGRMDHPNAAFRVLVEENPVKAYGYVQELNALNQARTAELGVMMREIHSELEKTGAHEHPIILVHGQWRPSLAGLAASKLVNLYHKPVLVIAKGEQGLVGSGRSIEGYNLIGALRQIEHYFDRLGGHPAACGFTVKEGAIDQLHHEIAQARVQSAPRTLVIDADYPLELLTLETARDLASLGPFGEGNPKPVFSSRAVLLSADTIGSDNRHLRMFLQAGKRRFKAVAFGLGGEYDKLQIQNPAEIAYELAINSWQGQDELDIHVKDVRQ